MNTQFWATVCTLLLLVVLAFVPPLTFNAALTRAQLESPPGISNTIVQAGAGVLPQWLVTRGAPLAEVDGQTPTEDPAAQHSRAIFGGFLRILEAIALLYPLRLAAVIPYFVVWLIVWAAAQVREIQRAQGKEFNVEIDTSGTVLPSPSPIPWGTVALWFAILLLLLPLPLPVWVSGSAVILSVVVGSLVAKPQRYPVQEG